MELAFDRRIGSLLPIAGSPSRMPGLCAFAVFAAMQFRSTFIDPESLEVMRGAFEDAWLAINAKAPIPMPQQADARDYLGHIIFGLWQRDVRIGLAAQAVAEYTSNPKWGRM